MLRTLCLLLLLIPSLCVAQEKQTVGIPTRDGASLSTDLYLPAGYQQGDRVPVIFVCTPYDKSRPSSADYWRDTFVNNGYAFAYQDMRGHYASASAGRGAPRHDDGYDTIEWLAAQPWCTGKVGMLGYSHLGAAQYEASVTTPPHLACALPAQAPANYYTDPLFPPALRKADYETILRGVFSARTVQLINRRIRSQQDNRLDNFNVPMLHSGGWYDFYKEGTIEMFRALQEHGGPGARGKQKLLIGPWGHGVLQEKDYGQPLELPGGMTYPANARHDWPKEIWLPWFDYWLKDKPTGIMEQPAVQYYLMGATDDADAPGNEWVNADTFPPPSMPTTYYAHADGTLTTEAPAAANAVRTYQYDPKNPVPTVGRVHARLPVNGPLDQRPVEDRPDVLVFATPPLSEPLKLVGQLRVRLWGASDRTDTDFTAKLTDVYPGGHSMIFADGIVRARYRNTFLREELLIPGQVYEFNLDLGYIALILAPGHRLRLALSSSNFDRFDLNPNTGQPYGDHAVSRALLAERLKAAPPPGEPQYTEALVATNSVYFDQSRPTQVILPVVP
ncbi:MAG: CocE/NonD family hydrolase [Armatimonadota bacterium]